MKIGIVTFFKANNYGALLQCHALYSFLKSIGHDVFLVETDLPEKNKTIRSKLRHAFFNSVAFERFRRNELPPVVPKNNMLDAVVFGSDQIWNVDITKEYYLEYFGSFLRSSVRRVAYAASFGVSNWEHQDLSDSVKLEIRKFSAVGVREGCGVEIAKEPFGVDSTQVLDPTLLLDSHNYVDIYKPRESSKHLVSYIFNKNNEKIEKVKSLSERLDLKMVLLSDVRARKGIKSIPYPSVSKWLSYLASSQFVVTDSFHCMVFAIINKKNFVAIPAIKSRAGRMTSLLSELGLSDRFFQDLDSALESEVIWENIDYFGVDEKLSKLREQSREFLISSIN